MVPTRYHEFLKFVFDRPVIDHSNSNQWYFTLDEFFECGDEEAVELYNCLLQNCERDLADYSDDQVGLGINYLFNSSCSNLMFQAYAGSADEERQVCAIRNLKYLYANCFEIRCVPILGHLDEAGRNLLNNICYMFWDVTPINYIPEKSRVSRKEYIVAIFEVMTEVLSSSNEACIESALHGLGHMAHNYKIQVTQIIDAFLSSRPTLRIELINYAEAAKTGCIN